MALTKVELTELKRVSTAFSISLETLHCLGGQLKIYSASSLPVTGPYMVGEIGLQGSSGPDVNSAVWFFSHLPDLSGFLWISLSILRLRPLPHPAQDLPILSMSPVKSTTKCSRGDEQKLDLPLPGLIIDFFFSTSPILFSRPSIESLFRTYLDSTHHTLSLAILGHLPPLTRYIKYLSCSSSLTYACLYFILNPAASVTL